MTYDLIYQLPTGQRVLTHIDAATEAQAEYVAQHIVPRGAAIEEIELPKAA